MSRSVSTSDSFTVTHAGFAALLRPPATSRALQLTRIFGLRAAERALLLGSLATELGRSVATTLHRPRNYHHDSGPVLGADMLYDLIESVERARERVINAVKDLRPDQAMVKPSPEIWSIVENVEHLYLAELSGLTKIWAAAIQVRSGSRWTENRPNDGQSIETVVDRTWKAREVAPAIATPHIGGPLSAWVSCLKSLRPVLLDLAKELEGIDLQSIVYPHYLSGPLDGRQRLEFLRFHMERHLAQIQRVQAHPQFPG